MTKACKNSVMKAHRIKISVSLLITIILILSSVPVIAADQSPKLPPATFSELVKEVSPSVVYISTKTVVRTRDTFPFEQNPNDPFNDFFRRFFGDRVNPRDLPPQRGLGTGFIIDKDGYILTNNHIVERADTIDVTLENEEEFKAKVIGRDPETDLALIKIDGAKNLAPLELGDSNELEVGDWVVAIGNPYGLGNTVTAGIVSAKYRDINSGPFDDFIQTDASINPGNSGGPLMNTDGEVIGINSMIYSQTGQNIGIGFAIPVNMAKDLLPMLKEGKVVRGYLGASVRDINPVLKDKFKLENDNGALISHLTPNGPAEKAGLQHGDVIIGFKGEKVEDSSELVSMVSSTPVGTKAEVEIVRKGKKKTFHIPLGERPGTEESPAIVETSSSDLGLEMEEVTPEMARRWGLSRTEGLLVTRVEYNSPAEEAGLRRGDIILEVDLEKVTTIDDFNRRIQDYKPGDGIVLFIMRQDTTIYLTLKIWDEEE
jgi:serine protease Do